MPLLKEFDNKKHLLGYDDIDTLHKEFLDIYNSVELENSQSLRTTVAKLLEHTKGHFASEERLMQEFGYSRAREHIDEHHKVLAEMEYFLNIKNSPFGDKMLKSYYIERLPEWYDTHLLSMDSDLAHFIKERSV